MPLSVFNQYVAGVPEPGDTLIHNTFSGAYVVVDSTVVDTLRKADRGEPLTDDERALVDDPDLSDPDVGVVVASLEEEEREFRDWFARRRDRDVLDCIVGVNLACNFACSYCSQAEVMDGTVMKPEVCDATARWLVDRGARAGVRRIHLIFVGGEPLLHPDRIERIVRGVRDRSPAGVEVGFTLLTNGYFLDRAMVDRLLPLGLERAQITLDGDQSTHCTTRISKRGDDSYRRIFDNLIEASQRIGITVNGNYQPDTVHGFEGLIRELAAAGLPSGSKLTFSPALAGLSSSDGVGSGSCSWTGSDMRRQVEFHDTIFAAGYEPNPLGAIGPCELHDKNGYAIEPTGTIYKCPGFLGHPEWGIGSVTGGVDEDRYQAFLDATPKSSPCGGCSHRPNCGGGCLAADWLARGSMDGVNCEKGYFESVQEAAVTRGFAIAVTESIEEAIERFPEPKDDARIRARRPDALRVVAA